MKISIESTCPQPNPMKNGSEAANNLQNENLKDLFIDVLKKKNEYDAACIDVHNGDTISVSNVSSIALHSFVLEAEKLGKDISYTKKTIIEIL